jgi:hypothetical protein
MTLSKEIILVLTKDLTYCNLPNFMQLIGVAAVEETSCTFHSPLNLCLPRDLVQLFPIFPS